MTKMKNVTPRAYFIYFNEDLTPCYLYAEVEVLNENKYKNYKYLDRLEIVDILDEDLYNSEFFEDDELENIEELWEEDIIEFLKTEKALIQKLVPYLKSINFEKPYLHE